MAKTQKEPPDKLTETIHGIRDIDKEKLFRTSLGTVTLQPKLEPKLKWLEFKLEVILRHASDVTEATRSSVTQILEQLCTALQNQSNLEDNQFVPARDVFLNSVNSHIERIRSLWPEFAIAEMESNGLLSIESITDKLTQLNEKITSQEEQISQKSETFSKHVDSAMNNFQKTASRLIKEAQEKAQIIEGKARLTAHGTSLSDAQKQFSEAEGVYKEQVKHWTWASIVFFVLLVGTTTAFFFLKIDPDFYSIIYSAAIRVTILAALGAGTAFCLRMLRAHMHLRQRNLHRKRLANSLGAFVESETVPEQRSLILALLVDAIASFGNSGLLQKEDDSVQLSKIVLDSLSKTIGSKP